MKLLRGVLLTFCCTAIVMSSAAQKKKDHTTQVDPFIGTAVTDSHAPGATLPYAMIQVNPVTKTGSWNWISRYNFQDSVLYGFANSHLSGLGKPDQCDVVFMPTTGKPQLDPALYASGFKKKNESAHPGYYKTTLDKYDITAELTATTRAAMQLYAFPSTPQANILLNIGHGAVEIINDHELNGYVEKIHSHQKLYYHVKFSKAFKSYGIAVGGNLKKEQKKADGDDIKLYVQFVNPGDVIVKTGISAVGYEGALRNLDAEMPGFDFKQIVKAAKIAWIDELAKIDAEGGAPGYRPQQGTTNDLLIDATGKKKSPLPDFAGIKARVFYTALYHSMLSPNIYSDVDGKYVAMDSSGLADPTIRTAQGFTFYSSFNAFNKPVSPPSLLTLIDKKRATDLINSYLAIYDAKRSLSNGPAHRAFSSLGYQMIPLITDAYGKGIRSFNAEKAIEAMKYVQDVDEKFVANYTQGFADTNIVNSISNILRSSYNDWCIAQMAKMLNKQVDHNFYIARSQYWKNIHNMGNGFMQTRTGGWKVPFDPLRAMPEYADQNAWQYAFAVPHDVNTLIDRDGGNDPFTMKLNDLFSTPSKSDKTGLIGLYDHGAGAANAAPYLYNFTNDANRTQFYVIKISRELYTEKPEGLPGADINGSLSSWYVMSCLGIYNIAPGQQQYQIGIPQFAKTVVNLENGKQFKIFNSGMSINWNNIYLQGINMDKKSYNKLYIDYNDIAKGSELEVFTGTLPNRLSMQDMERSVSRIGDNLITPNPVITLLQTFAPPSQVEIKSNDTEPNKIYYTLDGSTPTTSSKLYEKSIPLKGKMTIKAIAVKNGKASLVTTAAFE